MCTIYIILRNYKSNIYSYICINTKIKGFLYIYNSNEPYIIIFRKGFVDYLCPQNPFEIIFRKGYLGYLCPKNNSIKYLLITNAYNVPMIQYYVNLSIDFNKIR